MRKMPWALPASKVRSSLPSGPRSRVMNSKNRSGHGLLGVEVQAVDVQFGHEVLRHLLGQVGMGEHRQCVLVGPQLLAEQADQFAPFGWRHQAPTGERADRPVEAVSSSCLEAATSRPIPAPSIGLRAIRSPPDRSAGSRPTARRMSWGLTWWPPPCRAGTASRTGLPGIPPTRTPEAGRTRMSAVSPPGPGRPWRRSPPRW